MSGPSRYERAQSRVDLRTVDDHCSWREVYGILGVETSIDPDDDEDRKGRMNDACDSRASFDDETMSSFYSASTTGTDEKSRENRRRYNSDLTEVGQ